LSYNYLLTLVAELRRAGFVKMRRGPAGRLQLARPAHAITLGEIICAFDGPLTLADFHSDVANRLDVLLWSSPNSDRDDRNIAR
jgi:DNA-binding IscR family transcriptional regulator